MHSIWFAKQLQRLIDEVPQMLSAITRYFRVEQFISIFFTIQQQFCLVLVSSMLSRLSIISNLFGKLTFINSADTNSILFHLHRSRFHAFLWFRRSSYFHSFCVEYSRIDERHIYCFPTIDSQLY